MNQQIIYNYYLKNFHTLIKYYRLEYEWIDLNNYNFYNGVINAPSPNDYNLKYSNQWLNKYHYYQQGLGEEILTEGILSPFIILEKNNKKYIVAGRHRYYSLLFNSKIKKINRKFLFIKLFNKNENLNFSKKYPIFFFNEDGEVKEVFLKTTYQINNLLLQTGDNLINFYQRINKKINPLPILQNENNFQKWIEEDYII